ncbi:uncharacterized protein LOC144432124 [Styela clava]
MAVQDKGGFDEVCASNGWEDIVMECCDPLKCQSTSMASTTMKYYSKHLLPYEMHVKNCKLSTSLQELPVLANVGRQESKKLKKVFEKKFKPVKKNEKSMMTSEMRQMAEKKILEELEEDIEDFFNEFSDVLGPKKEEGDIDSVKLGDDDNGACPENLFPNDRTCSRNLEDLAVTKVEVTSVKSFNGNETDIEDRIPEAQRSRRVLNAADTIHELFKDDDLLESMLAGSNKTLGPGFESQQE